MPPLLDLGHRSNKYAVEKTKSDDENLVLDFGSHSMHGKIIDSVQRLRSYVERDRVVR